MNKRTLFVSNLPTNISKRQLHSAFESFGNVTSIEIPNSTIVKYNGCAFIVFSSVFSADKAMIMNGQPIGQNDVHVKKARDKELSFFDDVQLET